MALGIANRQRGFWFGTEEKSGWFPTPNRGADMSPTGWEDSGTLLNGGGYNFSSFGSHKQYTFEWPASSQRKYAELLKAYADGTYGRGLIYFVDCLMFDRNVLPARVADPSMAIGYEGSTLVYGVQPTAVPQSSGERDFPVQGALYNLSAVKPGFRRGAGGVYLPVPEGYTLAVGAFHSFTGSGGVWVTPVLSTGALGAAVKLSALDEASPRLLEDTFSGVSGVHLWVGRDSSVNSSVTIRGLIARLIKDERMPAELDRVASDPWSPGQGNSGCRFEGKPTFVATGPVNGGQVGFAATFKEVGSWVNG